MARLAHRICRPALCSSCTSDSTLAHRYLANELDCCLPVAGNKIKMQKSCKGATECAANLYCKQGEALAIVLPPECPHQ